MQALVDAVEARPWDYTLAGHPIVDTLRLAPENYGDRLFIHPPFFVYSMAVLRRLARLPLPGYALLCQVCACVSPFCAVLGSYSPHFFPPLTPPRC